MKSLILIGIILLNWIPSNLINQPSNKLITTTFCHNDYMETGHKYELSLIDGGEFIIQIKNQNDELLRRGTGKWEGKNDGPGGSLPIIYVYLSSGTLKFEAYVSSEIYMLVDSKDNQWLRCYPD